MNVTDIKKRQREHDTLAKKKKIDTNIISNRKVTRKK